MPLNAYALLRLVLDVLPSLGLVPRSGVTKSGVVDLDPNTFVPAYTIYNARLTIANDDESLSLTIGGTNLGDKRVLNQVIDATFFPGTYFAQQANGRQLFVAIAAQF